MITKIVRIGSFSELSPHILIMPPKICVTRLLRELKELKKSPLENILAAPREEDILEWHYVIIGPKGSPFEGGYYHGIVTFPPQYPYKPPSIQMLTPNGRFKTATRLCLSMSDFHPESWNPMWSVGTILVGLISFFMEETPTVGSITTSSAFKREAANSSLAFNCKDKKFRELFPDLVALHAQRQALAHQEKPIDNEVVITKPTTGRSEPSKFKWLLLLIIGIVLTALLTIAVGFHFQRGAA